LARPHQPRRLCILIIDDDIDAAQTLGALCEQSGHEVDFAYDGASGVEAARRLQPDIVFARLALPGLDKDQLRDRVTVALPADPALIESLLR
jgi:DNA-binding response OmpR family regulator